MKNPNRLLPLALVTLLLGLPARAATPQEDQAAGDTATAVETPMANISIDVTLTEILGDTTKSRAVHLTVAEGRAGRIRSHVDHEMLPLFVDATPRRLENGKILVELSLQISVLNPRALEDESKVRVSITDSLTVLLDEDQPMIVARSADTFSDLEVEVEVTASVQR
jgi:hypothetical protein